MMSEYIDPSVSDLPHSEYWDMPSFQEGNMIWVWDAESHTYVQKPSAELEQDRGHSTGGDNDLFNQNQLEHSELAGMPELEGHMAARFPRPGDYGAFLADFRQWSLEELQEEHNRLLAGPQLGCAWPRANYRLALEQALGEKQRTSTQGEWAPKGRVKCPQCTEITDQPECPICHKDLTPEWNAEQDSNNEFFGAPDVHSDASEFTSWPERVPKRNREKTDDSYPSMNLSSYEAAIRLSRYEKISQDEWDNIFGGDTPLRTEVGKWLIDKRGAFHFVQGMNTQHEDIAERDRIQYPADVGALGSVYNDGTADVQIVFPGYQFDHDGTQAQLEQAFGPVTLAAQVGRGGGTTKGPTFEPFEIHAGQWLVSPQSQAQPLTGIAWVKERPEGESFQRNMILVAEHLQPEDFQLWMQGVVAIVTATGGLTSHAAYLAMTDGIPVVVGIGDSYNKLETGDYLKIEPVSETITVMPGATGDMSSEQKRQISDIYMQYQKARGGSLKPEFAHYDEELAWKEANSPSLDECPECRDPMADQDGEKVCHSCGHKQPIIHSAGAAAFALPVAEEVLGGGLAGEAAGVGGVGSGAGGQGIAGIGSLMNNALGRGVAFRGGENMVGGGQPSPGVAPSADEVDSGAGSAGVVSHTHQAGIVGDLVEFLLNSVKKAPEAFVDPKNPLSYADDIAGVASGASELGQQGTPPPTTAKTVDTFGEDEAGWATKNRGDNSDPDQQSSSGADTKERGDAPEQLKDVDGIGGPKDSDAQDDLGHQGDPALQEKALKTLHLNLPLVIEYANSDEPGAENPILVALDQLLEEAFPGYKNGTGEGEDEHPVEEINVEIPSNDGEPKDESEDESGKKPDEGDSKEKTSSDDSPDEFGLTPEDDDDRWRKTCPVCKGTGKGEGGLGRGCPRCDGAGSLYEPHTRSKETSVWHFAMLEEEEEDAGAGAWWLKDSGYDVISFGPGGMDPSMMAQPSPGMTGLPGTPATTGVPTCPMCGQSHLPGTPCPTDPSAVTAPTQQGAQIMPPAPNKVITKWQVVEAAFEDAPAAAIRNSVDEPTQWGQVGNANASECPGHPAGPNDPMGQTVYCDGSCQAGQSRHQPELDVGGRIPGWPEGRPANASASVAVVDNEFAFFAAAEEGEHHSEHVIDHHPEETPWQDETGAPLQKGAQYELKSSDYAIPDRITVDRVLPDKLVYTTDAGEVKYRNEITAQDVATNDYTFAPVELDNSGLDSSDGFQDYEAPTRPGQDATPQVDDLSTPQTLVSHSETQGLDDYTGSFNGDAPNDRSWLMDGDSSSIDVDPGLMAKFAGKDYSPREQREFIDEKGEARNLDRLDLEGTHYIVDDGYGDTLW